MELAELELVVLAELDQLVQQLVGLVVQAKQVELVVQVKLAELVELDRQVLLVELVELAQAELVV